MLEIFGIYHRVHNKRSLEIQKLVPFHLPYGIIYVIGSAGFKSLDWLENSQCCTQAEICPVHHLLVSSKRHHAQPLGDILGTKRL